MSRQIDAPDDSETVWIAEQLVAAGQLVRKCTGGTLTGELSDLASLQAAVDKLCRDEQGGHDAYALGLAFGQVYLENRAGFDWCMVEDEYGRDVALRFRDSSLLVFPGSMFSNRHEDGEAIRVTVLYASLSREIDAIREDLGNAN